MKKVLILISVLSTLIMAGNTDIKPLTPVAPIEPMHTKIPVFIGIGGATCPCDDENIQLGLAASIKHKLWSVGYLGVSGMVMQNYYEANAFYQTPTVYGFGALAGYTKNSNCDGFNYGASFEHKRLRVEYWQNTRSLYGMWRIAL